MSTLVAYATRYGATRGIAEHIAERLTAAGVQAEAKPVDTAHDLERYDAFVIGSAAYMGSWLKEAAGFVRRNEALLATRPVWLFSSGPVGTESKDPLGRDALVAAEPKEFAEFERTIKPRSTRVFYGAFDVRNLGLSGLAIRAVPRMRALLPDGDFRDWADIAAWAEKIATELTPVAVGAA